MKQLQGHISVDCYDFSMLVQPCLMCLQLVPTRAADECRCLQVLNRLSAFLAAVSFFGVLIIFLVLLVARDAGVGYSLVTAFVIFVSSVPIGVPVVTTTVLAVGARQMAKEKAIVSR